MTRASVVGNERAYRLITSRGLAGAAKKHVEIGPGEAMTLCRLEGAGRIVRFWLTLPLFGQRHALKGAVVRMYWDGEAEPSVEVPLGDFFGAAFGKPTRLISDRLLVVGGAYVCHFEMPFNNGALIQLHNQMEKELRTVFFQVGYYDEPQRLTPEATLHAQFRREERTRVGAPFVALDAVGQGRFAGLRVDLQTRHWWLRPPLSEIAVPKGFGLGILEGWEQIVIDGDPKSALIGTGAEDYFSGGFYFLGGPFCTPTYGCTHRNFFTGRVSAYRFHVNDPIPFSSSIRVTLDHGFENSMTGDYSSVAYWYQQEPHAPFQPLPHVGQRRVALAWSNPVQWLFLFSLFALLLVGAVSYLVTL